MLLLLSSAKPTGQDTPTPEPPAEPTTPQEQQNKNRKHEQTIWEILGYVQWQETRQIWQRMENERKKEHPIQKNMIKHCARVRKEEWKQLSRYAILRPYCGEKYSSLTHLIIHLGIGENPYTRPTCTCPLKPDNISIREIWDSVQAITTPDKQSLITKAQSKTNNARKTEEAP